MLATRVTIMDVQGCRTSCWQCKCICGNRCEHQHLVHYHWFGGENHLNTIRVGQLVVHVLYWGNMCTIEDTTVMIDDWYHKIEDGVVVMCCCWLLNECARCYVVLRMNQSSSLRGKIHSCMWGAQFCDHPSWTVWWNTVNIEIQQLRVPY